MKITKVMLQCKRCGYKTMNGSSMMTIESKKWLKKKIKDKMILCPHCESRGPFKIVQESA